MAKNWIKGAIKHPGALRKTLGAKEGKPIPRAKLESAAHGNGTTAKRARLALTLRKMHTGGVVPADGMYDMKKGEVIIPTDKMTKGPDYHFVSHTKDLDVAHVNEVHAFPNGSDASGIGHWEGDGSDIKFVSKA